MRKILKIVFYFLLTIIVFLTCIFIVVHFTTKASNDRVWSEDQSVLAYAEIDNNLISIHNIRNFSYSSTATYTPNYYDKTFDLNKIKRVWYVVEPFSGIPGSAHTFLSFEFEGNQYISISVEIRKEKGESFNPIEGLFNKYELMYVIADEQDVIKVRTNYRKDLVYLYPAKATKEKVQALFLDMIERTNTLKNHPEFYNSITNTCTTNIVRHIDKITPNKVPLFNLSVLLPEGSDRLAYKLGLIDTDLSFQDARAKYLINDKAMKYGNDPDFSEKIRD